MANPLQCRVVADSNIDDFQNRLNDLLGTLTDIADDYTKVEIEYSTTVITTYPTDTNSPVQKPYYSALVWFIGKIAVPV